MIINKEHLEIINNAYSELVQKHMQIASALFHRIFELKSEFYNGHYRKDDNGEWIEELFPIPVIEVRGFCDVEIGFEKITVSTKLGRRQALDYSFEKFKSYSFEAYGVEDYLADYYHDGQTIEDLKDNIRKCREKEIGFSFSFPYETEGKTIFEFVKLLRREGFYY